MLGQTLDNKYQIERELGRGGMGTVYLAMHLGTERPVAVKIIAPQFMKRPEFVERFRREARAAGRLRHPNVVDVTDFGFADSEGGTVAYLVMEYLDGCTLGEILEEEKHLPVTWTLDIIEQVCFAVHEAHEQGIIHRDLKPDNIWLEPNHRGGYTVKVLDFGIAKLEEHGEGDAARRPLSGDHDYAPKRASETVADVSRSDTIHDSVTPTIAREAATALFAVPKLADESDDPNSSEASTALFSKVATPEANEDSTRLLHDPLPTGNGSRSASELSLAPESRSKAADLTRVGAVLGTPLYMSPEQCLGAKLDPRSDVYSIGVILYQMLSGATPFSGDFTKVMEAHREQAPPPLAAKYVRRKLKSIIHDSLSKDPEKRPESAEAFANALRSRADGIFGLLRRAAMIYTEHMPRFLMLSALIMIPSMIITLALVTVAFLKLGGSIPSPWGGILWTVLTVVLAIGNAYAAHFIIGTITWIVSQALSVPLRPIKARSALREAGKKWRTFAFTGIMNTVISFMVAPAVFAVVFIVPFLILWAIFGLETVSILVPIILGSLAAMAAFFACSVALMLVPSVVMMESKRGFSALRRSYQLVRRSAMTSVAAFACMFLLPLLAAGMLSYIINVSAKAFSPNTSITKEARSENDAASPEAADASKASDLNWNIGFGKQNKAEEEDMDKDMSRRLKRTALDSASCRSH